jgi:hypothetical protein
MACRGHEAHKQHSRIYGAERLHCEVPHVRRQSSDCWYNHGQPGYNWIFPGTCKLTEALQAAQLSMQYLNLTQSGVLVEAQQDYPPVKWTPRWTRSRTFRNHIEAEFRSMLLHWGSRHARHYWTRGSRRPVQSSNRVLSKCGQ